MPAAAHNRFWAADTSYAKKNGGKYDFVVEEEKAIPVDKVIDIINILSTLQIISSSKKIFLLAIKGINQK